MIQLKYLPIKRLCQSAILAQPLAIYILHPTLKKIILYLIMKKLLTTLLIICTFTIAKAQMLFVPADSIILWAQDDTNFRTITQKISPSLTEHISQAKLNDDLSILKESWAKRIPLKQKTSNLGYEAANQLYTAAQLLRHTSDATYARAIQNLAFFPLLHSAKTSASMPERFAAAQALTNAISTTYATEGNKFFINYYANSSAFIKTDSLNFQIDAITTMPYERRVKLRFSRIKPSTGIRFKVYLQLPEGNWNERNLPIFCNGHDTRYKLENGYAVIENLWQSGYEIYFDLPTPLYLEAD